MVRVIYVHWRPFEKLLRARPLPPAIILGIFMSNPHLYTDPGTDDARSRKGEKPTASGYRIDDVKKDKLLAVALQLLLDSRKPLRLCSRLIKSLPFDTDILTSEKYLAANFDPSVQRESPTSVIWRDLHVEVSLSFLKGKVPLYSIIYQASCSVFDNWERSGSFASSDGRTLQILRLLGVDGDNGATPPCENFQEISEILGTVSSFWSYEPLWRYRFWDWLAAATLEHLVNLRSMRESASRSINIFNIVHSGSFLQGRILKHRVVSEVNCLGEYNFGLLTHL